ncbi:PREDICTED: uncharacterized protein LOC106807723 [Priapulus caudatus]|uniref:Uncharacterized protein LOC106807723 n=1 Tax=Priapulus caudatus TaxID=37621 RepID=A0ABM1E0C3_PRICU|nr:PREDICTED: uncharacterized protein LOC106807723 [Priapulus caudatus]
MAEGRMDSAGASCDCARHARRLHVGARTMAVCLLVVLSGRVCTSLNKGSTVATDAALVSNRTVVLPSSGREGGGYRNVTAILDRLLSTYDPQLRPGFGLMIVP